MNKLEVIYFSATYAAGVGVGAGIAVNSIGLTCLGSALGCLVIISKVLNRRTLS